MRYVVLSILVLIGCSDKEPPLSYSEYVQDQKVMYSQLQSIQASLNYIIQEMQYSEAYLQTHHTETQNILVSMSIVMQIFHQKLSDARCFEHK